jgi:FMN phosphatase YigB (HAD superfamily)
MSTYATVIVKSEPECIVVDLDGTLVFTDTFVATILEVVRKRPLRILGLIAALFRSRAECKQLAASLALLDIASLPYNQPLIEYLRQQRTAGRRIVLATGADLSIARGVADHLGLFEEIIASENHCQRKWTQCNWFRKGPCNS